MRRAERHHHQEPTMIEIITRSYAPDHVRTCRLVFWRRRVEWRVFRVHRAARQLSAATTRTAAIATRDALASVNAVRAFDPPLHEIENAPR